MHKCVVVLSTTTSAADRSGTSNEGDEMPWGGRKAQAGQFFLQSVNPKNGPTHAFLLSPPPPPRWFYTYILNFGYYEYITFPPNKTLMLDECYITLFKKWLF